MGAWLSEAFIPTQGFQGWPWDIHCGCKTVDNMALLVIYCLLGIVACRPTKAGITALRNKAIRSPLPLFDFGSISYIMVCSDSNAGNLSSGQSPLSAVTTEAWKDVFLRILEDSLKTIQCENPTWHTPGFLRKLQLAAKEKKKSDAFLVYFFLCFPVFHLLFLWRAGFAGGLARREEWLLESHLWHDYYKRQWTRTCFSPFFPPKIMNSKLSCACMKVL